MVSSKEKMRGTSSLRSPVLESRCGLRLPRRTFLADLGMGFAGLALGSMLARDGIAREPAPDGRRHFAPKARSVIWLFMAGGVSHTESFDPKPALNKYAGKSLADTPFKDAFDSPFVTENFRPFVEGNTRTFRKKIYPMQVGYGPRGRSGIGLLGSRTRRDGGPSCWSPSPVRRFSTARWGSGPHGRGGPMRCSWLNGQATRTSGLVTCGTETHRLRCCGSCCRCRSRPGRNRSRYHHPWRRGTTGALTTGARPRGQVFRPGKIERVAGGSSRTRGD